jgi:hypothetical protein
MTREPDDDTPETARERRLEFQRDRARARSAAARWTAIIVVASLGTVAWLFRWDVTPTTGEAGFPTAVVLDRLTGTLYYLRQSHTVQIGPRP